MASLLIGLIHPPHRKQLRSYARPMTVSSAASAVAAAAVDAPFVGRERELAALERCATEARHGEPRMVLVEGQGGVGKSALLARFLRRLPDACVVRASGAEPELSLPFGLIGQLVANADLASRDAPLPTADPLVVGADLAVLLGQAHATGKLVVLAVDDLHWADPESARRAAVRVAPDARRSLPRGALRKASRVRPAGRRVGAFRERGLPGEQAAPRRPGHRGGAITGAGNPGWRVVTAGGIPPREPHWRQPRALSGRARGE